MIARLIAIATHRILAYIAIALIVTFAVNPDIIIDVMGKDLLLDIGDLWISKEH